MQTRVAPFAALGAGWLEGLSRNTRAQLRRSERAYGAFGAIGVERASPGVVDEWLDALVALHAATWAGRGVRSGFVSPEVQRFTRALLGRGGDGAAACLSRVTAGAVVVGYLLNFEAGGRIAAYQSGFDYGRAPEHGKPGMTCHAAAIRAGIGAGAVEYDFLAGDARYKRSLSTGCRELHWLVWQPRFSLGGIVVLARRVAGR